MIRGKSKKEAINIYLKLFNKRPGKSFDPFIDFIHDLEYKAILAEAQAKDKIHWWEGQIRIVKEHTIQYNKMHKKYKILVADNKKLFAENEKLKKKNTILSTWVNKKCKKFLKRKYKQLKKMKVKIKDKDKKK